MYEKNDVSWYNVSDSRHVRGTRNSLNSISRVCSAIAFNEFRSIRCREDPKTAGAQLGVTGNPTLPRLGITTGFRRALFQCPGKFRRSFPARLHYGLCIESDALLGRQRKRKSARSISLGRPRLCPVGVSAAEVKVPLGVSR